MQFTVTRHWYTPDSTCGILAVNGVFFCYTLEPCADQSKGKPYCIPEGTYKLALSFSEKFQRITPHVLDVPGFTEIEIHPGNYPQDTEGCLLVGKTHYDNFVGVSVVAFNELMQKFSGAVSADTTITYQREAL